MSDPVAARAPILSDWSLVYEGFDPAQEPLREALCALGNGRFACRAAAAEADADGVHYPGTYAAGCYNRLTSEVAGREVEDESNVNLPNWLHLSFRIADGEWFDVARVRLADYRQELDLRRAVLTRRLRFHDAEGRETEMTERRFVSMARPEHRRAPDDPASGQLVGQRDLPLGARRPGVQRRRRALSGPREPPSGADRGACCGLRDDPARGRDQPVAHPGRRGRAHAAPARRRDRPGHDHGDRGAGLDRPRDPVGGDPGRGDRGGEGRRPCTRRASRRSPSRAWRLAGRWFAWAGFDELLSRARAALGGALGSLLARAGGRRGARPDRAAPPHLPPAGNHLRAHRRHRRRGPGPRAGRRGVPRTRLLGRAVHLPLPQPAPPGSHADPASLSLSAAPMRARWAARDRVSTGPSTRGRAARTAPS